MLAALGADGLPDDWKLSCPLAPVGRQNHAATKKTASKTK